MLTRNIASVLYTEVNAQQSETSQKGTSNHIIIIEMRTRISTLVLAPCTESHNSACDHTVQGINACQIASTEGFPYRFMAWRQISLLYLVKVLDAHEGLRPL